MLLLLTVTATRSIRSNRNQYLTFLLQFCFVLLYPDLGRIFPSFRLRLISVPWMFLSTFFLPHQSEGLSETLVFAYHCAPILGKIVHVLQSTFSGKSRILLFFPVSRSRSRINNFDINQVSLRIEWWYRRWGKVLACMTPSVQLKYRWVNSKFHKGRINCVTNFTSWLLQSTFHYNLTFTGGYERYV